jgi:acetyl-CoA synthetase
MPTRSSVAAWDEARRLLTRPDASMNLAWAAVDRNVDEGRGDKIALRFLSKSGDVEKLSYRSLLAESSRFASALAEHGIPFGARVYSLLGRVPELYVTMLGTLRRGAVFTPLFSAFGPEPVQTRMEIGKADVLVTTRALYRKKIASWRAELPSLEWVLLVDGPPAQLPEGTLHFSEFMASGADDYEAARTNPEDLALLHFTSGTTGKPKGVMHCHEAVVAHHTSAAAALDMRSDDIYWCTADPGWVTGTSYGIVAPLTHGVTMVVDEAEFDPRRWYRILEEERVQVWYTAPTAIRMLMKAGTALASERTYDDLRFMASVGEPLNPKAVLWGVEAFGQPFHDNWWQTETGSIMIANRAGAELKPGSMGQTLPGVDAAVARHNGALEIIEGVDEIGELVLRTPWPSMMRGYLGEMERFRKCFVDGWYLTGDLVRRDADGYFWFVSRADDVIQSAGHLISPFEVESALVAHPAVAEAGVIGLPDEVTGEVVSAYVAVNDGVMEDEALRRDLMAHARRRLGPSVAPRTIEFRSDLPKTRSGKIMRRLLKARALGLDEGDTSTLESPVHE